jgi:type I restriction-modification system DNA methylase subunit
MQNVDWAVIASDIDSHGYMTGIEREKSRIKATAEVFTPTEVVVAILKEIPFEYLQPGKSVFDPACGDGQFLAGVLAVKLRFFEMTREAALSEIYGVDILRDNVKLCKKRLGGGNIALGNSLNPTLEIVGQTRRDKELLSKIFSDDDQLF